MLLAANSSDTRGPAQPIAKSQFSTLLIFALVLQIDISPLASLINNQSAVKEIRPTGSDGIIA
jgi:hypothetical protein